MSGSGAHCPTCGSPVTVYTSDEGTSFYAPGRAHEDALQEDARALTSVGHGLVLGEPVSLGSYAWVEAAFNILAALAADRQREAVSDKAGRPDPKSAAGSSSPAAALSLADRLHNELEDCAAVSGGAAHPHADKETT